MVETARSKPPHASLEHSLLLAIGKYPYLTAEQAVKLLGFSPRSITHIREKLKRLADASYVVRYDKVRQLGIPLAHVLSTKGGHYVVSAEGVVKLTLQKSEIAEKSPYFILHTQAVNDVLIGAELLTRTVPQVVLNRMLHELELKHEPIYVDVPTPTREGASKSVRIGLIADGILDFHIQNIWQDFIAFEVYRTFLDERRWKEKVRAYVVYARDYHEKRFGTPALTIAVFALLGDRLRDTLKRWTEEELTRIQAVEQGSRFFFRSMDTATTSPTHMYLQPVWYQAFEPKPLPLLLLEEDDTS